MPYNKVCKLWSGKNESFFRDKEIIPLRQSGPHCVSTCLAMLTGKTPETFQGIINTQDPISWSNAIKKYDIKLAYCSTDARRLKFYIPELLELDDLFTLSYYKPGDHPATILNDPDDKGWICGSHIVVMHRNLILDPATGSRTKAHEDKCNEYYTKRIFRVVPLNHIQGL
ncbi:MAG: hypothetical protein QY310_04145 [Candidatus Jettenia sp. CY-1]|nr:MAG: hypothetical protein QY310_04145 [Candidatus Jettenia sp. CY-1]